jgi:RluA family pseudouridine synthase
MKQIKPSLDDLGQRLDRYLRKVFPGAKLGEIYEALRTKKITIGGKKLPESTKLREGDVLDIDVSPETLKLWQQKESITRIIHEKLDPSRILYQDSDILVYDKPSGLIVHSPDHKTDEVSLIEQIEDYLVNSGWKPSGTFAHPALAHRIDRDTSGIIISCLNRQSYEHMAEQFRTRKVEKTYLALVAGVPEPREGIIDAPLLRLDTGRTDEAKVVVDPQGQSAETSYRVLKTGSKNDWSLVELHPKTGRTHQIRVHMSHIGHPLIGDRRYG